MSYSDPPAHPWSPAKKSASNVPRPPSPSAVAFLMGPALGKFVHPQIPSHSWWWATSLMGEKGEGATASLPPCNLCRRVLLHKTESKHSQAQCQPYVLCNITSDVTSATHHLTYWQLWPIGNKKEWSVSDAKASEMQLWWNCLLKE